MSLGTSDARPRAGIGGAALARNTALNFAGLAVPLAVGFLTIPFVIRSLGTTRFGILSIVWIVFGYFGMFELGLGRTTTKYIAEALGKGEPERVPGYFWTTVVLQVGVGAAGLILLYLATPLLSKGVLRIPTEYIEETQRTLRLVALSLPVNFVSSSFRGILEAAQRFDLVNAVKVPLNALFYFLPLAGALLGFQLPGIVIMLILSRVLGLALWAFLSFRVFPVLGSGPIFYRGYLRPLLSFSGWLAASGILYTIITSLDRLVIGNRVGMDDVGFYSAPYEAVSRVGIIPGSLSLVLFPAFSYLNGGGEDDRMEAIMARSVKFLLILTGPLLLLVSFFSREILSLWLGPDFALRSTVVLQLLALGFLVSTLVTVAYNYLQGIGRVEVPTKLQALELVITSAMMWAFVGAWGITGAALATALRLVISTAVNFWAAGRYGRLRLRRLWEGGTARLVFLLAAYSAGMLFSSHVLRAKLAGALVLTAGLVPAIALFVLAPEERLFLRTKLAPAISRGKRP